SYASRQYPSNRVLAWYDTLFASLCWSEGGAEDKTAHSPRLASTRAAQGPPARAPRRHRRAPEPAARRRGGRGEPAGGDAAAGRAGRRARRSAVRARLV